MRLQEDDNFPHLVGDGKAARIADKPPTIYHFTDDIDPKNKVDPECIFTSYKKTLPPERLCLFEQYVLKDVAFKAVGVGSVGTFCAIGLFLSRDGAPMFLQFKQASKSVLECLGPHFRHHSGRRVVEGQRTMQAASDVFLGWATGSGTERRHFYYRQLWDGKWSAELELFREPGILAYARVCGWALARAHARSGSAVALAAYLGGGDRFDRAMLEFGEAYADQNDRDYAAVTAAIADGRLEAVAGL